MNLNLKKPLIIFDIEATGPRPAVDRIVEISMTKVSADNSTLSKTWLINPTIPIPNVVSEIHGYYDADVKDKPTFKQASQEIFDFIGDADLAGYNSNRFDIPMLVEEFLRCNIDLNAEARKCVDVMKIFMKKEQRTLSAALKFYCGKEMVNAHKGDVDVAATFDVLKAQLERYPDILNDVDFLHEYSKDGEFVDFARRIYIKEGEYYVNFGKHKDKKVYEVFEREPQYYNWIMNNDFALDTKNKLKKIKLEYQLNKSKQ